MTTPRWGVYCLANDLVLDWALALFESLREFAPELPLLVIPYDERQAELGRRLAAAGRGYLEHDEIEALHRLGRRFYPDDEFAARGFRKLAAFSGPFERFFLLDSDVLALSPLAELVAAVERERPDLVHFDTDPDQVYRPGPLLDALVAAGRGRGFNAGLLIGRRGILDAARLEATLADLGADWRDRLVPNAEQPFLNLYADRVLLRLAHAHELVADACSTCWPAVGRIERARDSWRLRESGRWDEGWRLLFAHWAGHRLSPAMPNREVWEFFRRRAGA
ncbi:MAG: hypothetical protein F9K18_06125 [Thermoanaerobaculia bacterium]|nr:MAG: hypothetical protein F9K18_06125 [Thermoanaerobaculia bacterium]